MKEAIANDFVLSPVSFNAFLYSRAIAVARKGNVDMI